MSLTIAFEGPEGSGKTTMIKVVANLLRREFGKNVLIKIEPGGSEAGKDIRDIILNKPYSSKLQPSTYVLLYSASRSEFVHEITEWTRENPDGIVLSDRCWWSTFVFQSIDGASDDYITKVSEPFMKIWPDKVALLCLPPEESVVRIATEKRLEGKDRLNNWRDEQDMGVFSRVWDKYLCLASKYRDKTCLVDSFLAPEVVCHKLVSEVLGIETRPLHEVHDTYFSATKEIMGVEFAHQLSIESIVRDELGIPYKGALQEKMTEELISRGLINPGQQGERRK